MKAVSATLFAAMVLCASALPAASAENAAPYNEKVQWSFTSGTDGAFPQGGLINVNGMLYGTTTNGGHDHSSGTVFSFDPVTGAEQVLYAFGVAPDGVSPEGTLVALNGLLYGTTYTGGNSAGGTVFSVDPNTGAETVLYSFCSQANCADGKNPVGAAGSIAVNGKLYGMTYQGGGKGCGGAGCGTVYSVDPGTGAEKVVYSFCQLQNCTDGALPTGLINVKGMLYGATYGGGIAAKACGNFACGVLFSLDPKTGIETVLYSFCSRKKCADGQQPAGLIAANGLLYGTSFSGGSGCHPGHPCGTVFSFHPSTGAEKVLYSFCRLPNCADGAELIAGPIHAGGMLYGTTLAGGADDWGTVFAVDPNTGAETVLHSFCGQPCADGATPYFGKLLDVGGNLYGTTESGGTANKGTVFVLEKAR